MLEPIPDLPLNVLAFDAHGRVTAQDYERVLIPALERKLEDREKVSLLYRLAPDFEGYTAKAAWDDLKLSVRHWKHFDKIAIVTDSKWIKRLMKAMGALFPAEVRVVPERDYEIAKRWIAGGAPVAKAAA